MGGITYVRNRDKSGSCLQSLGCWGVFILCVVGTGFIVSKVGDMGGYLGIILLIASAAVSYFLCYWIPEQLNKKID